VRSRSLSGWLMGALCLCCVVAQAQPAPAPVTSPPSATASTAGTERPTRDTIAAQVRALRADPQFGGTHQQKTLRWKPSEPEKKKPINPGDADWIKWLREFGLWLSEAGRVLIWTAGALAVALLGVGLRHWMREHAGAAGRTATPLPSHVRDLDIRPESLPEQIGAAAAALWQRGEQRAALSLLYRGALSRLVHDHGIPIRAASTEGECVVLAAQRLGPERSGFFAGLVSAWQQAVYGAHVPESALVLALCAEFDRQLRGAAPEVAAA